MNRTTNYFYLQFHLFREALALSEFLLFFTTPFILAQKLFLRPSSALVLGCGAGGFKLEPVSRLYFARPLALNPAPDLVESFSPRPTDRLTDFLARAISSYF